MFLNLTGVACDDLVAATEAYWVNKLPHQWTVTPSKKAETNYPFNAEFVSGSRGLEIDKRPFVDECPSSIGFIERVANNDFIEWLSVVSQFYPDAGLASTHYMDEVGFMAWRTGQLDRIPSKYRLYATFNATTGSVFKYILPGTTEVVVFEEPVGWYFKLFRVDTAMPHCVVSGSQRWSIGTHF